MFKKLIGFVLVIVVTAGIAVGAELDAEIRRLQNTESMRYLGAPSVTSEPSQLTPSSGSDAELLLKMQEKRKQEQQLGQQEYLNPEFEKRRIVIGEEQAVRRIADKEKNRLLVTGESGDGLVKLTWKVLKMPGRTDDQILRFTIRYGVESEKLIKSVSVGGAHEYILRELKNYQPYYVQIIAMDLNQLVLYKSDELQVTPLPQDVQGSRIEKAFARAPLTLLEKTEQEPFERGLKQFGYNFFSNSAQMAQSLDMLPATDEYLLGPGDTLKLSLWGSVNIQHELTVDRNGEVLIPRVGSVRVWSLSFARAKDVINAAIARYFRNYEMNLSIIRLRTIQVYVVGEVEAPGSYPISSMATVINALAAAGGPSRNGSLRSIKVTRGSQTIESVDLYDILLTGDRGKDLKLQNGDMIFVPVIGPVAAVAGEVRRPAIYELKGHVSLDQVLQMAGGLTASGYTGHIQLERLDNNARIVKDYVSVSGKFDETIAGTELQDRDMIKVFSVQSAARQVVSLRGNVQRPGEYQFKSGMRLVDLIPSSQVLLPESYLDSVEVTRVSPPEYRRELVTVSLRRAFEGSDADNIRLQEYDIIKIFSRWQMEEKPRVALDGAVVNPGVYEFFPGMTVRDLVTVGGSLKRNAFLGQAELSRVLISGDKAEARRISLDLGLAMTGDAAHNLSLQCDDVLIVRSVANWQDSTDKFVTLKGEVRFPGSYSLARGEKLGSLIARAGGFTDKAYLKGSKFTRRSVKEIQQKRMDEIIIKTENDILQKQSSVAAVASTKEELEATKATLESLQRKVDKLKTLKAEGRIVINLEEVKAGVDNNADIVLEGGDEIEIPVQPSVVTVLGYVYNPSSFVYSPSQNVQDYLNMTGGPVASADPSEIYVVRVDGSVLSRQQSFFGSFMSTKLDPGDTVIVPQRFEKVAWIRDLKDITQILANAAVFAGTIILGFR